MNARILSPRNRAVGFAIVVSIIMLSAAALAAVGTVATPASPSGSATPSPTVTVSPVGPGASSAGPLGGVAVGGSNIGVGSSTPPNPSPGAPRPSSLVVANLGPDPPVTFTPSNGTVESILTVTGTGFTPGDQVTPSFGGSTLSCNDATGIVAGDSSFACNITVPASSAGPYSIGASTPDDGGPFFAVGTFQVDPALTFSPSHGIVGSDVVLTGSGFTSSEVVTPYFNGTSAPCNEGPVDVVSDGSFTCTVTVPTSAAGAYVINASTPADGNVSAAGTFTVTPVLTFSPSIGDVGSSVTLNGTGFTPGDSVTPYFNSTSTSCNEGTVQVAGNGSFTCTVTVPPSAAGAYAIAAATLSDGTVVATGTFTVNPPVAAGDVTPASPVLDSGQSIGLVSHPSGGTTLYTYQWYSGTGSGGCTGTALGTGSTQSTGAPPTGTYHYCYVVTDSESHSASSAWDLVTVNSALTKPTISPSNPTIDSGQLVTFTSTWSGGSPNYTATLYSGSSSTCGLDTNVVQTLNSLATGSALFASFAPGASTHYCIGVTDSATAPTATNSSTSLVTVNAPLAASVISVAPTTIDSGQSALLTTTTSFSGGTSPYTCQWLVKAPGGSYVDLGSSFTSGCTTSSTPSTSTGGLSTLGTWSFELEVTDNTEASVTSNVVTVLVDATLAAPVISVVPSIIDSGQSALLSTTTSFSGGTAPYTCQWLVKAPGGSYVDLGASFTSGCTTASTPSTSTGVLSTLGTWGFELEVTDSTGASLPSTPVTVTVNSLLVVPAPSPVTQTVDQGQTATITVTAPTTGTIPYSYQWLEKAPGAGSYSSVTDCAAPATLTCSFVTTGATLTGSYSFELNVTDNTGATSTSVPASVTVDTALASASAPSVSTATIDQGQTPTAATDALPAALGGSGTVTYTWMVSFDSGAFAAATITQCATPSGTATNSEVVNCAIGATAAVGTYAYEIQLKDSASTPFTTTSATSGNVIVNSALARPATPTPNVTALDADQAMKVTGTIPSTGTSSYSWEWLVAINGGGTYLLTTLCLVNSGSGASGGAGVTCTIPGNTLIASTTYNFELQVTDNASAPEQVTSLASATVTTSSALTAGSPTPTAPVLDLGQSVPLVAHPSGGSGGDTFQWYWGASASDCLELDAQISGATSSTYLAGPGSTTYYCYVVMDTNFDISTSSVETVTVNSALTAPNPPTMSPTTLDVDQALTGTGVIPSTGSPSYSWQWLVSINGASYALATVCSVSHGSGASPGDTETCSIAASALTAGDTYAFELQVTDSATSPETEVSSASSSVVVSPALTAPVVPTVSATALDVDQALMVTGTMPSTGTPTYSWQWLVSVNGGAYIPATQCTQNSGSGASAGATARCNIATGALTVGDTYSFELKVSDSASPLETQTSRSSSTITVNLGLTSPSTPPVSATLLDVDQTLTVTGVIPSNGTASYSWQWLISLNGGPYATATVCAVNNGAAAAAKATEICSIATNTLTAGGAYTFELRVTDSASTPETLSSSASATVTVNLALVAGTPTPSSLSIDSGQSITVTTGPSGGSGPYTYQWYSGSTASACTALGTPISGATLATYSASPTTTTYYCYEVTDSATSPETQTSSASATVAVSAALTAPTAPTVSATSLTADQVLNVTASIPATGTPTYSWQWLVSVNGGAFAPATQCAANSGSKAAAGALETCSIAANTLTAGNTYAFELRVTDSASSPVTQTSAAAAAVTVTTPSSGSSIPWDYIGIIVVVLVVILLAALVLLRRGRPHEGGVPHAGGRPHAGGGAATPMHAWQEGPAPSVGEGPAASAPAYLETTEEVGHGSSVGAPAMAGGPAVDAGVPGMPEGEPDIDTLMGELDRISVDILKKPTKKGTGRKGETLTEDDDLSS